MNSPTNNHSGVTSANSASPVSAPPVAASPVAASAVSASPLAGSRIGASGDGTFRVGVVSDSASNGGAPRVTASSVRASSVSAPSVSASSVGATGVGASSVGASRIRGSTVRVPPLRKRARDALSALAVLARDPTRLDQVLVLTQAINFGLLARAADRIAATPEGAALFDEQPRIDRTHVDFDALRRLPDGTLGREYTRFLDDNGITPDAFAEMPAVGDARVAYMMLRMRQTHDLWHVLTGYTPDVPGELRLQAFTFAQTGAPSALLLVVFGSLRWTLTKKGHVREVLRGYRRGKAAKWLPTFRWEDHWETPVVALRAMLDCA